MENAAFTKLIINSLLMILTIILVWADLKTVKRIISILLAIAFIGVNFFYDSATDISAESAANAAKQKQKRDSTLNDSLTHAIISKTDSIKTLQLSTKDSIKTAIDSSYQNSVKVSNEALAKYNMQLQDSLKTIKFNSNFGLLRIAPYNNHPTIYNDADNDGKYLNVQFSSGDGSVFNINLKYYVINTIDRKYDRSSMNLYKVATLDSGNVIINQSINKDVITTSMCPIDTSLFKQKKLLVVLMGEYSIDFNNKIQRNFIYSFFYDFEAGKVISTTFLSFDDFIKWRSVKR